MVHILPLWLRRSSALLVSILTLHNLLIHAVNVRVDDTNAAHFQFDAGWKSVTPNTQCAECWIKPDLLKMTGGTWHDGADRFQASGSIKFNGTAISLVGINVNDNNPGQGGAMFRLDNNPVERYDSPRGTDKNIQYDAVLYRATDLTPDQEHILRFTVITSTAGGQSLVVDYADITLPDPTTSAGPTLLPTRTPTQSAIPEASNPPRNITESKTGGSKVAPIVGGVVGGLAMLGLLFVLWIVLGRRARLRQQCMNQGKSPVLASEFNDDMNPTNNYGSLTTAFANDQRLSPYAVRHGIAPASKHAAALQDGVQGSAREVEQSPPPAYVV